MKQFLPDKRAGWKFTCRSFKPNETLKPGADVIVMPVSGTAGRAFFQTKIHQAAEWQTQLPNQPYVVFVVISPSEEKTSMKRVVDPSNFIGEFETGLRSFQKPDRVDVTTSSERFDLGLKLSLIDAKLKASPRKSSLDHVKQVVEATADLRSNTGNLSAAKVADAFGISVSKLADAFGRSRQSVSKTPDAESLQDALCFYERVARLRAVVPGGRFKKWLKMPNAQLEGQKPLELLSEGDGQLVADLVDDMLTGAPA